MVHAEDSIRCDFGGVLRTWLDLQRTLPRRVLARAIPVHERSHREGMEQIMNARAVSMPLELFRRAQPYRLADGGEVVSGAAVGEAFATIRHEERFRRMGKKLIPFLGIGGHPGLGAA